MTPFCRAVRWFRGGRSAGRFLNQAGAVLFLVAAAIVSVYMMTSFTIEAAVERGRALGDPVDALRQRWQSWRESQRERAAARRSPQG